MLCHRYLAYFPSKLLVVLAVLFNTQLFSRSEI